MSYEDFLGRKSHVGGEHGFEPTFLPECLFDFQRSLIEWSLKKGRAATYADCGLGKTGMSLVWSENIVRKTNKPILIMTPLAVGPQFVSEGQKFGVECAQSRDGKLTSKIVVTNYERLHYFNPDDFIGAVCDESAVLKNFDGKTKADITNFMKRLPYRLLASATPAPNETLELGTSSEALGEMGYVDMLARFFKNDQNSNHPNRNWSGGKWRFRGHSERDFWRWVCSWARAVRKPSDLGFEDGNFILPPLVTREHVVSCDTQRAGWLLPTPAFTLAEQREERRITMKERCERSASLVLQNKGPSIAWCHLNPEGDLLQELIPGCVQVKGSDPVEKKEEYLEAFRNGQALNLVSKPEIAGYGLNFQHCAHQTFFPSHSFEQWYQAIRRSWRFGQKNSVTVDVVTSEGEARVLANLQRKAAAAEKMFARLVELMNEELKFEARTIKTSSIKTPSFLCR